MNLCEVNEFLSEIKSELIILDEMAKSTKLRKKYINPKTGRFKGKKGERFDNCVKMMKERGDVQDPEGLCAAIARKKGLA